MSLPSFLWALATACPIVASVSASTSLSRSYPECPSRSHPIRIVRGVTLERPSRPHPRKENQGPTPNCLDLVVVETLSIAQDLLIVGDLVIVEDQVTAEYLVTVEDLVTIQGPATVEDLKLLEIHEVSLNGPQGFAPGCPRGPTPE